MQQPSGAALPAQQPVSEGGPLLHHHHQTSSTSIVEDCSTAAGTAHFILRPKKIVALYVTEVKERVRSSAGIISAYRLPNAKIKRNIMEWMHSPNILGEQLSTAYSFPRP